MNHSHCGDVAAEYSTWVNSLHSRTCLVVQWLAIWVLWPSQGRLCETRLCAALRARRRANL
jgi:hypothetical protein